MGKVQKIEDEKLEEKTEFDLPESIKNTIYTTQKFQKKTNKKNSRCLDG